MKRAPIIPKSTPSATPMTTVTAPAAPMVDTLIARVGAMAKGNTITLPVCGREVKFVLETIPGADVASSTKVWSGNERDQAFLTEEALDDLIPSFLLSGQQNPAFGRKVNGHIEVADGSRRRMTAILTSSEYRILVGALDDEQMDALCKLGNDYRPTSAYERGKRYSQRLTNEFNGNISALADAENISRKIITRCINSSKLPRDVIALFSHPGELSARAGENLQKIFSENEALLLKGASELSEKRKAGVILEADEIIQSLIALLKDPNKKFNQAPEKREFVPGATVRYKGNKVIISLDRSKLFEEDIGKFEEMLELLAMKKNKH
ncbi:ParB/RepB/Spo0J family plasmid partition protein [Leclercia adecarboxylata]|uniref:ParB/RepB/Spo0J family plasmid partition protein n=1 Tax=Leclercia adecarboxylata TaxID=83655 RepID=UPI0021E6F5C7|nr:ParB/RepB/Spo0J family plasmid partition protein [Leclercia adecarboxylata]MCV3303764.1 ParB/RepB/Spo0J family plasmid partition protein [Leclercia adecarboxylata]MCV3306418.1 ParB/RepB/Spo0J family plasmid partition protein [Leclercia adecarboxylata]